MEGVKITWYPDEIFYLKKNFDSLSAKELLEHINLHRQYGIHISSLRAKCRELGLLKQERPEEWSERETNFLLNNYKKIGNVEICNRLNRYKNRTRFFTPKKVWKKMRLLKIKRTDRQLEKIRKINVENGQYAKSQYKAADKRRYPEGKKAIRKDKATGRKYWWIKHNDAMVQLHHVVWEQNNGKIPKDHKIYFKDGNSLNCKIDNLMCLKSRGIRYKNKKERADFLSGRNNAKPSRYVPSVSLPGVH